MSLDVVLNPRSIAVIGASENPGKIGGRPLMYLARHGFAGKVYPVNPVRDEVQGLRCFPTIASLPEVPEVAAVIVPGERAVAAVEELAAAGTQVAVVMSSGFGEVGPEGQALELHMRSVARAGGMRLIGPNSMGTVNFGSGTVLTFTTAFLELPCVDGPVAVVSQSGSMAVAPFTLLARQGIGVRHAHATGNDSDVTVAEMASLAAADPHVELLLLYFESVKDAAALAELGRIARERELPVIALKAGRSPAGAVAARSHTGALANEDRVVDAFLERQGIWRARDLDDLVRTAKLHLHGWRPRGNRVAVISNSGASCVQSADAAAEWGVELAVLRPETRAALDAALPGFATTTNPVDLTAAMIGNSDLFARVLPPLVADPSVDAVHLALPIAGQGYDIEAFARDLHDVALGRPVVISCPMPEHVTAPFVAHGLPLFTTETEAIAALGSYLGQRRRLAAALPKGVPSRARLPTGSSGRTLDEADSMAFVQAIGVAVVEHRLCRSVTEAVAAFHELGGVPVAVKGASSLLTHKSELGIVRLGVSTRAAVAEAFEAVDAILRRHDPDASGVVVAQMAKGRRELLLGAHHDPTFGPVVLVGDGGTYVEALSDVAVLLPPFTPDDVHEALSRLRIAPLLVGVRGELPMDTGAFAAAAVAIGRAMTDGATGLLTLDLNPMIVGSEGEGCVAADAVVIVAT